jgi:uncharacterized protein (DUF305 family)
MRSAAARIAAVFAVPLTATMLTACGGSPDRHGAPSSTDRSSGQADHNADHNADDIAFARTMVPRHQQAVQMAQMVPTNTTNPQVITLADRIITTQAPDIQAFRTFLMQWQDVQGHDAPGTDSSGVGMVDQATMDKLQSLAGPGFDRLWLTSMIDQHRGAIAMAQDEVAHGRNADVIYLARSIIANQQPEIDQMKQMLGG